MSNQKILVIRHVKAVRERVRPGPEIFKRSLRNIRSRKVAPQGKAIGSDARPRPDADSASTRSQLTVRIEQRIARRNGPGGSRLLARHGYAPQALPPRSYRASGASDGSETASVNSVTLKCR